MICFLNSVISKNEYFFLSDLANKVSITHCILPVIFTSKVTIIFSFPIKKVYLGYVFSLEFVKESRSS